MLHNTKVRWARHLVRMPDIQLPKRLFYGELVEGKRSQGVQKKRFKASMKASLKSLDIAPVSWERVALDRPTWYNRISKGATHEQRRVAEAERKRELRKSRATAASLSSVPTDYTCPICGSVFRARIGLINHSRTHRTLSTFNPVVRPSSLTICHHRRWQILVVNWVIGNCSEGTIVMSIKKGRLHNVTTALNIIGLLFIRCRTALFYFILCELYKIGAGNYFLSSFQELHIVYMRAWTTF